MRYPARRLRGSILMTITLLSIAIALITGVLLRYALVEARINRANLVPLEAKNAAEAALEYGAAELAVRFQSNRNFDSTSLVSNPVTAHSSRLDNLFAHSTSSPSSVVPDSVRLYISNTSAGISRRIDARDPNNSYDPLRGQTVSSRFIRLLSTATASSTAGESVAYATQAFEVRDSHLFNYAIFYNLRMEFHPGPDMEVWGPVHANETAYLTGASTVKYFDIVTTAGSLFAGSLSTTGRPSGRSIFFTNGSDSNSDGTPDLVGLSGHNFTVSNGSGGTTTVTTYVDSDLASRATGHSFSDKASQLWRGNVQDASLGIERQKPPGVLNPNDARKLIEPPDTSASLTESQASIEEQKFSRKAGLYLVVDNNSGSPRVTILPSANDAVAFKSAADRSAWLAANPSRVITPPTDLVNPNRRMRDNRENQVVNMIDIDLGKMRRALQSSASATEKFTVNGSNWNYQAGWNGVIYVDVENPNQGFTTTSDITAASGTRTGEVHGVGTGTGARTAVRLINAKELPTLAPTPAYPNRERGLSVATNAPIYIAGHFNANGTFGSNSSPDGTERSPDTNYRNGTPTNYDDDTEVPALIAADAINVLSSAWVNSAGIPIGDGKESNLDTANNRGRQADSTEVSAVFMGGIVETPSSGNGYSGGVENYPRFHENWNGDTFRYRGSIVALFDSAYATRPWRSYNVYSPPIRKWGFHDFLKNGEYPPFTPLLRTFRRIDYRDLSRAEYEALLADTTSGFTLMSASE